MYVTYCARRQHSFSALCVLLFRQLKVMEPDGSSHDQRIMAIGCDHGEMWLRVESAWAKVYVQYWLPRVPDRRFPLANPFSSALA